MATDDRPREVVLAARDDEPSELANRTRRLRAQALALDTRPGLLAFVRRLRHRLPGDERFGDTLSTTGVTPVQVIARGVSAVQPEREASSRNSA